MTVLYQSSCPRVKPSSGSVRDVQDADFTAVFSWFPLATTGSSKVTVDNKLEAGTWKCVRCQKEEREDTLTEMPGSQRPVSAGRIALSTTTTPEGIALFESNHWPWVIRKRLAYDKNILFSKEKKFAMHFRKISIKIIYIYIKLSSSYLGNSYSINIKWLKMLNVKGFGLWKFTLAFGRLLLFCSQRWEVLACLLAQHSDSSLSKTEFFWIIPSHVHEEQE